MPDFEALGAELGKLVNEKQASYGDSFGRSGAVLRILYPAGVKPEQYGDLLAVARVLDKLFRVATDRDAFGEDPWQDICGYSLLAVAKTVPSVEKATEVTESSCPLSSALCSPRWMSQILTTRSSPPEARILSSGEKAALKTPPT